VDGESGVQGPFKRSQVEAALWRALYVASHAAPVHPPLVFLTRVRRLLDLDRETPGETPGRAFTDTVPEGRGIECPFTAFDTFCLALALELLNRGFKAGEVVYLLRWVRRDLEPLHAWILADPPTIQEGRLGRGPAGRAQHPSRPAAPLSKHVADFAVFLIIESIEMDELEPAFVRRGGEPLILHPTICRGRQALFDEIDRRGLAFRSAMLVEVAALAALTAWWLPRLPAIPRGPRRRLARRTAVSP
jgi:hypothetical protein